MIMRMPASPMNKLSHWTGLPHNTQHTRQTPLAHGTLTTCTHNTHHLHTQHSPLAHTTLTTCTHNTHHLHTQHSPLAHTTLTTCTHNTHHLHTQHSHTTSTYRENPLIHLNYAILLHNNGEARAAGKQLQLFKSKSQTHTPSNTDPEVWNFISHATGLMYGMHFELNFIHVSGIQLELYVYTVTHIYTVCSCVFYR